MWRVIPEGATSVLEILGDKFVTCRLTRHEDGVWRGRWLRYERNPVELIPWDALHRMINREETTAKLG